MANPDQGASIPTQANYIKEILAHAACNGVTIDLDYEGTSDVARMGAPYSFHREDRILTISVDVLIEEGYKNVVLDLIRKYHEDGALILRKDKKETLTSYQSYTEAGIDQELLEFFKDKLSADDYEALKMACFIRSESEKGRNVYEYKKDIRQTFGPRGANIANLCSAGYFEKEFMPLYKSNPEAFAGYYDLAVGKKARALFIHSGMPIYDIETEFWRMVDKALRYHMKDFRIHGMGEVNVTTIKEFFRDRHSDPEEPFTIHVDTEKSYPTYAIEYIVRMK